MAKIKKEKVRVQDIAAALNISSSSVSRALNNHPRISKETKDKVKRVATSMGYYSGMPELMNPEKTEAIVILTTSLEPKLYREIILGATNFFDENNYQTLIVDTNGNDEQISTFFRSYSKYGISGIIHLVSNRFISDDFYAFPIAGKLPIVTVFEPDLTTGVSSVLPDVFQGVFRIVSYLKTLNIKSIALLLDDEAAPADFQVATSFESAFEMLDIKKSDLTIHYANKQDSKSENKIEQLLKSNRKPDVIIVVGVLQAMEVVHISEQNGLSIPKDLLLITICSDSNTPNMANNISMLKLPAYGMGWDAAKMLLHEINHPDSDVNTVIKPVSFLLKGSAIRMKD